MNISALNNFILEIHLLYAKNRQEGQTKFEAYDKAVRTKFKEIGKLQRTDAEYVCDALSDMRHQEGIQNETDH